MVRMLDGHVVRALTIAGSDSGGGAGIQADLKTLHQFQVYGMSVITALTAQNTVGVQGIYEVTSSFILMQLEPIFADLGADALKTGMLANADIICSVAAFLKGIRVQNLVVDPVMVAKGGSQLLAQDAVQSLVDDLLPLAKVVTPNLFEAEVLCGYAIQDWDTCHQAARDIAALGPNKVVIKGGHMPCNWHHGNAKLAVDMVYTGGKFTYFSTERVDSRKTHGTGCTFSAGITAMLAQGATVLNAIAASKAFIYAAIQGAQDWDVGVGHGPTDHFALLPGSFELESGNFYELCDGQWIVRQDWL